MERMAAHKLVPVRMKQADMNRADVQAFRCGSKPHETPLAVWIKSHSADEIRRGNKVWLYRLQDSNGSLVGYSSLATGKTEIVVEGSSKRMVKCFEIPMLALHEDYWGCPKGIIDDEEKFSRQIVRHVQQEAREAQLRGTRERLLTLYVHPDADPAQNLSGDCGITCAPGRFLPDPDIPPEKAPGLIGMDYVW